MDVARGGRIRAIQRDVFRFLPRARTEPFERKVRLRRGVARVIDAERHHRVFDGDLHVSRPVHLVKRDARSDDTRE